MDRSFFSIIITALNPGKRLTDTLESVLSQEFEDYEIIIKDGGSTDGSLDAAAKCLEADGFHCEEELSAEDRKDADRQKVWIKNVDGKAPAKELPSGKRVRVIGRKDRSIYDGMNQALEYIRGKYVIFLNCGDSFYNEKVLAEAAYFIRKAERAGAEQGIRQESVSSRGRGTRKKEMSESEEFSGMIFYGNQYNEQQETIVSSAPELNDFACYRNVPCHQVCFYDAALFAQRGYDLRYSVRADYEHFLYSVYERKAETMAMPIIIARYEGGGFSETKENRRRSAAEHREITEKYLGAAKCRRYRMVMLLTLAPLRTWIAENPRLSGLYNAMKSAIYRVLGRR